MADKKQKKSDKQFIKTKLKLAVDLLDDYNVGKDARGAKFNELMKASAVPELWEGFTNLRIKINKILRRILKFEKKPIDWDDYHKGGELKKISDELDELRSKFYKERRRRRNNNREEKEYAEKAKQKIKLAEKKGYITKKKAEALIKKFGPRRFKSHNYPDEVRNAQRGWYVPGEVIGKEKQVGIWRDSVLHEKLEKKWKKARKKADKKKIDKRKAEIAAETAAKTAAKAAETAAAAAAAQKLQQKEHRALPKNIMKRREAAKRQRQRKRDAKEEKPNTKIIGKRKEKLILKPKLKPKPKPIPKEKWKETTHKGNGHELHHYTGAQIKKILYDFNKANKKDKYKDMRNMTKSDMLSILRKDFSTKATKTHIILKHKNGHTDKIIYTQDKRSGGKKKKKVKEEDKRNRTSNKTAFKEHGYVPGGA